MSTSRPTKILVVGSVAALAFVGATGASAADEVTATVTQGARTASFLNAALPAVSSSHSDQNSAIPMTLTVDDSSGTGAGWSVTAKVSDFLYDGDYNGTDIPASNFSIVPGTVSAPDGAVAVPGASGSLDQPVTVLTASKSVNGAFSQVVQGTLSVPADSFAGTYKATLTTTISAAPSGS
ncbi:hypothetical protein FDK12_03975 [Arthrobacter sp. NamB2]|uniref:WxL domain-containing protein n=1 Tax=Arthrobacter sp. NamB2 TaxID=2576035 RepID=UPI0010C9A1E6|nr:WxL domain-containing protein [Arthrobacter sp. NamB2]TKV28837.1 hypothetical protein FDK12_03975 [Arthrobacter sp. NamB2]